jgi:hypothetical protein
MPQGTQAHEPILSINEARSLIRQHMREYLDMTDPDHMLLVSLPPGSGKTWEAVRQIEHWAGAARGRALFAGSRHDLFDDMMKMSGIPVAHQHNWWYHWQPHTGGDPETGQGQTCRWARQFRAWVERGHPGHDFCQKKNVCGYTYINEHCIWHGQKRRTQPIVFVQHLDVILGHPFLEQCTLLIGDESPLGAFLHPWAIPPRDIIPSTLFPSERSSRPELALDSEAIEVLRTLRDLSDRPPPKGIFWEGPALLEALGGAEHVQAVCAATKIALTDLDSPDLYGGPDSVDSAPYAHVVPLFRQLSREADEAAAEHAYISRVRVSKKELTLLLRRSQAKLPQHVIWLDATANADLYRAMFHRPVEVVAPRVQMTGKVYQVWASLNNRDNLLGEDTAKTPGQQAKNRSGKRDEITKQVQQIIRSQGYDNPFIVTYKALKSSFADFETAHFGSLRGTNQYQDFAAMIIVGTPQASISDLCDQAAMLHQERMQPFDARWSDQPQPYIGHDYGYAVSGFWHDPLLQSLLFQCREAELVQVAHRVRPLLKNAAIWLLTNLPLADLPPNELFSINELFQSPAGVDPYQWPAVLALVEQAGERGVRAEDIQRVFGVSKSTAYNWYSALIKLPHIIEKEHDSKGGRRMRYCIVCKGFSK